MATGTPPGAPKRAPRAEPLRWNPSREDVARWLKACAPDEPVSPKDDRYLSVAALRGEDAIVRLYDYITLKPGSSCQLFSGYTGTGKSSELLRLRDMLEDDGYIVLLADAAHYHDLFHPLELHELLVILAGAFGEATSKYAGKELVKEGYWGRFRDFMRSEVTADAFDAKTAVADVKFTVKHTRPFWLRVRDQLIKSTRKLEQDAHAFVRLCVEQLRQHFKDAKGVVFIMDSLERLRGPENELRETMASVVRVFSEYAGSLRLPGCHCIYTLPPYVDMLSQEVAGRYDGQVRILPAIRVNQRDRPEVPFDEGVALLQRLVEKRIPVQRIFGARQDLLQRLILQSGGHLRHLMEFLNELLVGSVRKGLPPQDEHVEQVLGFFAEKARSSITREGVPLLEHIRTHGSLDGLPMASMADVARFMDTRIVLCYRNGGGWYEIHPLVRQAVARLAAEQREQQQRAQAAGAAAGSEHPHPAEPSP